MTTMHELSIAAAFTIGLLGSAHCLGMCGGISSALGIAQSNHATRNIILYNSGRLFCYGLLGFTFGFLGELLGNTIVSAAMVLRVIAGLLLIAMGLYLSQWWTGLRYLEKLGAHFWRYLHPINRYLLPVDRPIKAIGLGFLWGFLPCGLIYSTLGLALANGAAVSSALVMVAFGVGTLPAMLAAGFASRGVLASLKQKRNRSIIGGLMCCCGVATIILPLLHSQHGVRHEHKHLHQYEIEEEKQITLLVSIPSQGKI